MPLKIQDPRPGRTPYYSIRGTYLGVYVDRSAKTGKRAIASQVLKRIEAEIERGEFAQRGDPTFADAALAYMKAGGERRFLTRLLKYFGDKSLKHFNEETIEEAAQKLYPEASPATRNRQVYTPVSAVLRSAKVRIELGRPKGGNGAKVTAWLWPEQIEGLFEEARRLDHRFEVLLITLCATGMRLSEALDLTWDRVRLEENYAFVPTTKTDEPRGVFLPPVAVRALQNLDRRRVKVFPFTKGGHIYSLLKTAAFKAGIDLPERSKFHLLRHTYATWMRRYGGADGRGLLATGAWKDRKSVDRYTHAVIDEEAKRALLLPMPEGKIVELVAGDIKSQ